MKKNIFTNLMKQSVEDLKNSVKDKLAVNNRQVSAKQTQNDFQPQNNHQNNENISHFGYSNFETNQYPNYNQNYQNPINGYSSNYNYVNHQQWNYPNSSQNFQNPQFVQIRCPQCGANLVIGNGIDTFYCQYCGNRVILMNPNKDSLDANLKLKEIEHREKLADKFLGHFERKREMKRIEEEKRHIEQEKQRIEAQKNSKYIIIGSLIILIAMFALIFHMADVEKRDGISEENRLQSILEEVYTDMSNLDFNAAMIKANSLHYTASYNQKENNQKWDDIRNSTIDVINNMLQNHSDLPESEAITVDSVNISIDNTNEISETAVQVIEETKNSSLLKEDQLNTSSITSNYDRSIADSIHNETIDDELTDVNVEIPADNPYRELPGLEVSTRTKYNHAFSKDSAIIQGNDESFDVLIETHNSEATLNDISILFDETEFRIVNISELYNTPGGFSVEMQCIAEGYHYLMVFTNYDLYEYEDEAMGFEIPVTKLNQYNGQVVYVSAYSGKNIIVPAHMLVITG